MVKKFLYVLMALSILMSLWVGYRRHQVESQNKTVSLVVDYEELKELSSLLGASSGASIEGLLLRFKEAGVNSVAVSEDTLESLVNSGDVSVVGALIPHEHKVRGAVGGISLMFGNEKLFARVKENLENKRLPGVLGSTAYGRYWLLGLHALGKQLSELGFGLNEDDVEELKSTGFHIIARLRNFSGVRPGAIDFMVKKLKELGIPRVIFAEEEVLGYKGHLDVAAKTLNKYGVIYGSVEFAGQRGDKELSNRLGGRLIRVHSITEEEMADMDRVVAVQRFIRAVRDRNIRICYLRLFKGAIENRVEFNKDYISAVKRGLENAGFKIGKAQPFEAFNTPLWCLYLVSLGVIGGGIVLLDGLVNSSDKLQLLILGVCLLMVTLGWYSSVNWMRKILALAAAVIFPTWAFVINRIRVSDSVVNIKASIKGVFSSLLSISGITLLGAILVVGLLSDLQFMVKVDEFTGVKLAFLLPMLLIASIYIGEIYSKGRHDKPQVGGFNDFLNQPVLTKHVILLILAVIVLALFLLRTGNLPIIKVPGSELKLRALLENILFARPRAKEFLVGHPALMLALWLALNGRRRYLTLFVVAGSIGQVSMVNTFCHIHTPVWTSALRSLMGLLVGIVLGLIVIGIYELGYRWLVKSQISEKI